MKVEENYMSNRSRKILIATLFLLFVGVSLTAQFHNPHPCTLKGIDCNGSGPEDIIFSFDTDTFDYVFDGTSRPFWVAVGDASTRTIDTSYVNSINATKLSGPGDFNGTPSGLLSKYIYFNDWNFTEPGVYEIEITIPGLESDTILIDVADAENFCEIFAGGCGSATGDAVVSLLGNGGIIPVDAIFPITIGLYNTAAGTLDTNFFNSGFVNQVSGPGNMYGTFSAFGGPWLNFNDIRFDAVGIYDLELKTNTSAIPDTIQVEVIDDNSVNTNRELEQGGLIVYPNPFSEFVTIQSNNGQLISELRVYNFQGQVVKFKTDVNSSSIQLSDFSAGTYFVELVIADTKQTQKGILVKK